MIADLYALTRVSLHGFAEIVLAGPQYRRTSEIALRVTPHGFATTTAPALALDRGHLVFDGGRVEIDGRSCAELAAAAGVEPGPPWDLYPEHAEVTVDQLLRVEPACLGTFVEAMSRGDAALRRFAPAENPILWPEHFDVGISLDQVNYGVSPGDGYSAEPYAYVGPWTPRSGEFWNAPFGAARPMRELPGDALDAFLAEGRGRARDPG